MTTDGDTDMDPVSAPDPSCWIDLTDDTLGDLDAIASRFHLHELAVEDARHAHQRPKLERYDDTMVVVAKPAVYDDDREAILVGELWLAVGSNFVVSVRHGVATDVTVAGNGFDADSSSRHRETGLVDRHPIDIAYQLLDTVVDAYQPIMDGLANDIVEIEQDVFSTARTNPAPRIYALKRQVLDMLRNVEPLVGPLDILSEGTELDGHDQQLDDYFRDVADHARRLVDQLHTVNDVLSDALQANLAQVTVAQNDDMRTMSAWAAIFLVPTLLAGLWGMNFDAMPELDWRYGYPAAIAVMVIASAGLWWQFRRSGWLGAPRERRRVRPSRSTPRRSTH